MDTENYTDNLDILKVNITINIYQYILDLANSGPGRARPDNTVLGQYLMCHASTADNFIERAGPDDPQAVPAR